MSLISVILYYTWRSERYAIYLSKSGRRMEKQYQVVQELQIEGKKKRVKGKEFRIQMRALLYTATSTFITNSSVPLPAYASGSDK